MGTVAVLSMLLAGGTIANAQTYVAPSVGETPVTYDNRNVLPDGNGQYGMVIPTAISFTDDKKEADASLEIVGVNGYDLDNDWQELDVSVKIKSSNGYNLVKDGDKNVSYTLKMDGNGSSFNANDQEQDITKHFGVSQGNGDIVKKDTGVATLTGKAPEKGQYLDTLTYTFTENTNVPA